MKTRNHVRYFLLIAIALCGASTYAMEKDEYVAAVMDVFRTHVSLMEELSVAHQFKYSDNLVRHANAIERTFELLGPMEWHAAQAAKLHGLQKGAAAELSEDMFEDLARASRKSLKQLVHTAHEAMEEYDREGIIESIDSMKQSCDNCHSLLPKSVAPDLWRPLERK